MKRTSASAEQEPCKLVSLPWDGTVLSDGCVLDPHKIFTLVQATDEGLNIRGGIATLTLAGKKSEKVVFKKLDAAATSGSVRVDRIKPLFDIPQNGSHYARVKFDPPMLIERKHGKGDIRICAKTAWVLLQRYIDAPSLRKKTPNGGLRSPVDAGFLRAFLFRMVTGTTDPNPSNFLVQSAERYYSVDEGSAFSEKMQPRLLARTDAEKPWLRANLAKYALGSLEHMREQAAAIANQWRQHILEDEKSRNQLRALLLLDCNIDIKKTAPADYYARERL